MHLSELEYILYGVSIWREYKLKEASVHRYEKDPDKIVDVVGGRNSGLEKASEQKVSVT